MTDPQANRLDPPLRLFLTEGAIRDRVAALGKEISATYGASPLTAVGVLRGGLLFLADLVRAIDSPLQLETLRCSSYHGGTVPAGPARIDLATAADFSNQDVLVIDDIVDTGHSLAAVRAFVMASRPRSLRTCVLLDKPSRRQVQVPVDWVGFEIPDSFVVGYGLDYQQRYRNLPYLAVLDGAAPDGHT